MDKTISEHIIRLSGKINIEKGLELGEDVSLGVKGSVVRITDEDNHDGTLTRTYVVKPESVLVRLSSLRA
jgi:hypothetical protein